MAKSNMPGTPGRSLVVWAAIIFMLAMVYQSVTSGPKAEEITYSDFMKRAENREFVTVKVIEAEHALQGETSAKKLYVSQYAGATDVVEKLRVTGADVSVIASGKGGIMSALLIALLPILLIGGLIFFMMRGVASQNNRAIGFGSSKAKAIDPKKVPERFKDVIAPEAVQEVGEILDFLKSPARFRKLGARIPKGVLLIGPPGCGKTLLARAVAGESGAHFLSLSGSDFVEMFVGVGASRVRDLFEQAKKRSPCVIFIDEIDAVGRHRGSGLGNGHDEREQTLNQLLVEMDGFGNHDGIIVMAATNRPDVLDPALLRPGRFDRRVVMASPDVIARAEILATHVRRRGIPLSADVDLSIWARKTPGMSGADLENLLNEAAIFAARADRESVISEDMAAAHEKVILGPERKHQLLSPDKKRRVAGHEAGHALLTLLAKLSDPFHKVTIVSRGMALGVSMSLPEEDHILMTAGELRARIMVILGGRVAEKLLYGDCSTGASDDLQKASQTAREMICRYGMGKDLGPVAYAEERAPTFLGRDIGERAPYSEATIREIDVAVSEMLKGIEAKAEETLQSHIEALRKFQEALDERETMSADDVRELLPDLPYRSIEV